MLWRSLARQASYINYGAQSMSGLRTMLFRSSILSPQELAETGKKLASFPVSELRHHIGKEDYFKNFFITLSSNTDTMKSEDLVSLVASLVSNPDLRDYKHTYNLWPVACRTLCLRAESLNLDQAIEVMHVICFLRINHTISNDLSSAILRRIEAFTQNDFNKLSMNKFNSLLWSLANRRSESVRVYSMIYNAFFNHKDLMHLSYDVLALHYNLFNLLKIKEVYEITKPLKEKIVNAFLQNKPKSLSENIDIMYYLNSANVGEEDMTELNQTIIDKISGKPLTSHQIMRLCNADFTWTPEMLVIIKTILIAGLRDISVPDLISVYISRLFLESKDLHELIIEELKNRRIEPASISFAKIEKILNQFLGIESMFSKDLWPILSEFCLKILAEPHIGDNLLIKIITWMGYIGESSEDFIKTFTQRIIEKERLPYYHSRDLMNLTILVATFPRIQTEYYYKLLDDKLFSYSHSMDYAEINKSLYFLIRKKRAGYELQELLLKRMLDRDITLVSGEEFSVACYNGVMNNNIEFCKKSFTFARILLMGFNEFSPSELKIGEIIKKPGTEFNITRLSAIRLAWMMTYMNIKDLRIMNSRLYEKLEDFELSDQVKIPMNSKAYRIDAYHVYLLLQVLAINCPEREKTQLLMKNFDLLIEQVADENSFNILEPEDEKFYKEFAEVAESMGLRVDRNKKLTSANLIYLTVEDRPVIFYTSRHYQYESEGFYSHAKAGDIYGIYKMRVRMLKGLGASPVEVQASEWKAGMDERKALLSSLFIVNKI